VYPAARVLTIQTAVGLTSNCSGVATFIPSWKNASRILGATPALQSLRQITAPLLHATGVIATCASFFHRVMRELSAGDRSVYLADQGCCSVLIYDLNESGDLAAIAVLGSRMLIITFAVVLASPDPGIRRQRHRAIAAMLNVPPQPL